MNNTSIDLIVVTCGDLVVWAIEVVFSDFYMQTLGSSINTSIIGRPVFTANIKDHLLVNQLGSNRDLGFVFVYSQAVAVVWQWVVLALQLCFVYNCVFSVCFQTLL